MRYHFLSLIFSLTLLGNSRANAATFTPSMPTDPGQLEFYLHTIGLGNHLWDNFGHTAIRVVNQEDGTDLVFNWGLFDFSDPLTFGFQFYRGILIYQLGIYPTRAALRIYKTDGREVFEDRINLSSAEKSLLMQRLVWHAAEENRSYRYDYFFDNCSTRPRDYLDEALGGQLKAATTTMTGESYRDMVRSHYAALPFVRVSLDLLMNSRIEREMSVWAKMFLPQTLRTAMLSMRTSAGQPLLEPVQVIVAGSAPVGPPEWLYALCLVVAHLPLAWLAYTRMRRQTAQALQLRLVGLVATVSAFLFGAYGLLMPLCWAFSEHQDLHHNANQWLFWPLDWLGLILSWPLLRHGRYALIGQKKRRLLHAYFGLHLLALLVYLSLFAAGYFVQELGEVLRFLFVLALSQFSLGFISTRQGKL